MEELLAAIITLFNVFRESNFIVYTILYIFVLFILSGYTIKYSIIIVKQFSPQELTKFLGLLTVIVYLANNEPKLFIISLAFVPFFFAKEIKNLSQDKSMRAELEKYKERRSKIYGRQDFDFFDILFIYNMISLTDYEKLYDEHFDKSDSEKINYLQSSVILDEDKKLVATYLLNYYRKNNSLLKVDELNIDDIRERIRD